MPFVQRIVEPVRLSRVKLHDDNGAPTVDDRELDAVTNFALANTLRQMASVATLADEVFRDLRGQLLDVATRSTNLKCRVQALGDLVARVDPKTVTVPESDLTAFSLRTDNFKSKQPETKNLLSADNRPAWVKRLYDQAGVPSKVYEYKHQFHRAETRRRKRSLDDSCLHNDIELRKPAALTNLRPWTSEEVLGDITVAPDCSSRIPRDPSPSYTDQVDHKLPSPEEQQHVVALKFPPQIVEVDISGRSFNRMSALRRSLQNVEYETSVRRRKSRRPRGKRRNTIAGTDQKELEAVIGSLSDSNKDSDDVVSSSTTVVVTEKKSNLDLLKDWGRTRLKQFKSIESSAGLAAVKLREKGKVGLARRKWDSKDEPVHSSSGNWSASSESGQSTSTSHVPRSSVSSCSGSTKPNYHGGSSVTSDEGETGSTYSCDTEGYYTSFHVDSGLKTLREEDPPLQPMSALHTTSALSPSFQSSSAESEYDVFGRGSTSTTASSAGTVCTSLMVSPPNVPERGGSKLSDPYGGSLPDRNLHAGCPPKDSIYDKSKTAPSRLTKENVTRYKEERLMIDVKPRPNVENCGDSPDSGHNTCSSPVDSITNPSVDLEMSECSDLEGIDRVERLRVKTTINTSRIPSMCVITPPISDDEVSLKTLRQTGVEDYDEYVTLAHVMPELAATVRPVQVVNDFVHMNELPAGSLERKKMGARVTLNAEGKVIYTSDSLKRRKKIHTTNTFEPGPCVSTNVELQLPGIKKNVISQAIPRSPLNIRPVAKQIFPVQKTATISKTHSGAPQNPQPSKPVNAGPIVNPQLKPLVPISLSCSPGQRRSRTSAPPVTAATVNHMMTRQSSRVVLPDSCRDPNSGKPVSPLISPTRRSLSPKEVVKGAYVRMQDPTDCLETSLDEIKSVIKRSDSYRQANSDSPRPAKSPNMLMALQKARSENAQGSCTGTPTKNINNNRNNDSSEVDNSNVSASTPVKAHGTPNRIDMSSANLSPIQRSPAGCYGRPSPVSLSTNNSKRSPPPSAVTVRPASGRSAMDLYAAIHESKKRLLGVYQPVPATAVERHPTQASPPGPVAAEIRRPAERQSDRVHRRDNNPSTARYDFKRLLLHANMSGGRRNGGQSAVTRLQQPPPQPQPTNRTSVVESGSRLLRSAPPQPRLLQTTGRAGRAQASWNKSNVLSSTIQEDCREDEDGYGSGVPKSTALVKQTLRGFADKNNCCAAVVPTVVSTLETAL
ncbi:uncharacterized protein LOC126835635 [Adelges cooleyi]|uniref:uncharacterized protein LOC126835635 n=1 Tax=Adelges cooleyi TaxID=133065 RepID=UPI0021805AEC|nr:uncharacterized protein LOC126835635 [Adelges cooleyi]